MITVARLLETNNANCTTTLCRSKKEPIKQLVECYYHQTTADNAHNEIFLYALTHKISFKL